MHYIHNLFNCYLFCLVLRWCHHLGKIDLKVSGQNGHKPKGSNLNATNRKGHKPERPQTRIAKKKKKKKHNPKWLQTEIVTDVNLPQTERPYKGMGPNFLNAHYVYTLKSKGKPNHFDMFIFIFETSWYVTYYGPLLFVSFLDQLSWSFNVTLILLNHLIHNARKGFVWSFKLEGWRYHPWQAWKQLNIYLTPLLMVLIKYCCIAVLKKTINNILFGV